MSEPGRIDRRGVLLGGLSLAGGAALAQLAGCGQSADQTATAAPAPRSDPGSTLILLELYGGIDGLSVVVPTGNDDYYRARPTTQIKASEVLPLREDRGLHPTLKRLRKRFHRGEVAIVEGAGYPDPIYSHFRSFEVWHTARAAGRASGPGWIGRLRDAAWSEDPRSELTLHVGGDLPYSLVSQSHPALAFSAPSNFQWFADERAHAALSKSTALKSGASPLAGREAVLARMRNTLTTANATSECVATAIANHRPNVTYPQTPLADELRTVAALMNAGFPTRVYSVAFGNFDAHGAILRGGYFRLLRELDQALDAFLADIAHTSLGERAFVLAFSEFGRRVQENESRGTDHGAAGPMFMVGPRVRGGFYGEHPSLVELDGNGNLIHTLDFRRVYASVLRDAFGIEPARVLDADFAPLPLLA